MCLLSSFEFFGPIEFFSQFSVDISWKFRSWAFSWCLRMPKSSSESKIRTVQSFFRRFLENSLTVLAWAEVPEPSRNSRNFGSSRNSKRILQKSPKNGPKKTLNRSNFWFRRSFRHSKTSGESSWSKFSRNVDRKLWKKFYWSKKFKWTQKTQKMAI